MGVADHYDRSETVYTCSHVRSLSLITVHHSFLFLILGLGSLSLIFLLATQKSGVNDHWRVQSRPKAITVYD